MPFHSCLIFDKYESQGAIIGSNCIVVAVRATQRYGKSILTENYEINIPVLNTAILVSEYQPVATMTGAACSSAFVKASNFRTQSLKVALVKEIASPEEFFQLILASVTKHRKRYSMNDNGSKCQKNPYECESVTKRLQRL